MSSPSRAGFTLIELMVVIGIISLLVVFLAPRLLESKMATNIAADAGNLRWHYQQITEYKRKFRRWPRGGGHKFVLDTWVREVCEHTPENRDRYFTPGLMEEDEYYQDEIRTRDPRDLWKRLEDLSSQDTHYAGRAKGKYRGMESGNEAWMANDNELGPAFQDGTINVLVGNGNVRQLLKRDQLQEYWQDVYDEEGFPVGPDSPYPLLQDLEK